VDENDEQRGEAGEKARLIRRRRALAEIELSGARHQEMRNIATRMVRGRGVVATETRCGMRWLRTGGQPRRRDIQRHDSLANRYGDIFQIVVAGV